MKKKLIIRNPHIHLATYGTCTFKFAVVITDSYGEIIHTFKTKKQAEEFYAIVTDKNYTHLGQKK